MKFNFLYLMGTLCLTLSFASCNNDDSADPSSNGSLEFKLDGTDWQAEGGIVAIVIHTDQTGIWSKTLNITGTGADGELFTLLVTDIRNAEEGECLNYEIYYALGDDKVEENYIESSNGIDFSSGSTSSLIYSDNTSYNSNAGFIEITDCGDKKISGNFELNLWTLENGNLVEMAITEGKFKDVEYIIQ